MNLTSIWNTISRHLVLIIIALTAIIFLNIYFGKFFWEFTATLLMISLAEAMAMALSNVAVYVYTKLNFTGIDKDTNSNTLGFIFLGVHFLVGIGLVGIYIANFN